MSASAEIADAAAGGGASAHGATAADVVVAEGDSLDGRRAPRRGREAASARAQKHLGLRVFVGERSAIISTRRLLARRAGAARRGHRARWRASPRRSVQRPARAARAGHAPCPTSISTIPPCRALTAEQAIEWCKAAEAAALERRPAHHQLRGRRVRRRDSHGRLRRRASASSGSLPQLELLAVGRAGRRRRTAPCSATTGTARSASWRGSRRRRRSGARRRRARCAGSARARCRRARCRSSSTPRWPPACSRHLAGAVSGNALYKGTSFLHRQARRDGSRPTFVTVVDDGTLARRARLEAVRRRGPADAPHRRWSSAACSTSYLFDTYSARKLQSRIDRQRRALGRRRAARGADQLLSRSRRRRRPRRSSARCRSGLYVTELIGFGVNPVTGDYSRGAVGLWIENGELAYPVEEITIAGNLLAMFQRHRGGRQRPRPAPRVAAPTIKIARMTVAGN